MDLAHTILYTACALLNLIIGGVLIWQNPRSKSHRYLFLFTLVQFFWISFLYLAYYYTQPYQPEQSYLFTRLTYGIGGFMIPILPAFFYYFPRKTLKLPRGTIQVLFGIAFFFFFASTFTSLIHESQILINGYYAADTFGPLYNLYAFFQTASLLLGVGIATKKIFDLHGLEQKQLIIATVGCWVFVGLTLMTNAVLPIFDIYIFQQESAAFSLFFIFPAFVNILLQSNIKEETAMLKQLIDRKTQSLKKQNEKIKTLVQQQSDFIAVAAHEFRTPLTIAMLQLEDTLSSTELTASAREEMQVIDGSLNKLKHLTQDLFDVQQYDLNKAQLSAQNVDLFDFMRTIYEEFEDIMAKKSITLELDYMPIEVVTIAIDGPKMRQVLHNLLNNAYKFTPEKGRVIIHVETTETEVLIQIIDNGKGIPDEQKILLFQKFKSGKSTDAGIGLGLYLCKKIVELHQGTINVDDAPGGGTSFQIGLTKNVIQPAAVASPVR